MITTITYTAVSFLIAMFSSWVGSLIALRPLGKPPPVFWVDRARLAYPARQTTMKNPWFLCILVGLMANGSCNGFVNQFTIVQIGAMVIGAYTGAFVIFLLTEKRIRGTAFRWSNQLRGIGFRLVLYIPLYLLLIIALLLPKTFNLWTIIILIPAILILVFFVLGGGYVIVRWVGMTQTASQRLLNIVADASARTGIKPQGIDVLESSVPRAAALPLWGRLIFTDRILELLDDPELTTICVHELAHLNEPYHVYALRIVRSFVLFLSLLLIRPIWGEFGKTGLYAIFYGALFILVLTRFKASRIGRLMEERADAAGRTHQGQEGIYAKALECLYEANLIPVTMPPQLRPHPDLYDRLIAAGVKPSYPRPSAPSNDRRFYAILVTIVIAITLYGILFVEFGIPTPVS